MKDNGGGQTDTPLDLAHPKNAYDLYEKAPGFIATTRGPSHRFTFANTSYRRFVEMEDLVGRTVAEALPQIADQGILELLDNVYRTGEPFIGKDLAVKVIDPADRSVMTRYCDCVYQAIRGDDNDIVGIFCEGYDVTTQHEAANEVFSLQSQLIHVARVNAAGTMATMLAHELNQPLIAISSYAAGMMKTIDRVAPQSDRLAYGLKGIEDASKRAAEVIRNLRHLTRPRDFLRTEFDLKTAVAECLRLVRPTVSPDIEIIDDTLDGMTMFADRIQIQQILINLLRNACDAVIESDPCTVTISAKQTNTCLIVSVTDTGHGVPLEIAEGIFSWSVTSKDDGMGLGLSICRTIIEYNHGRIWLENSGDTGSEFCFSVPRAPCSQ